MKYVASEGIKPPTEFAQLRTMDRICPETIKYDLKVLTYDGVVEKECSARTSAGLSSFQANPKQLRTLLRGFFSRHFPVVKREQGPFRCVACGNCATVFINMPLSQKASLVDLVSAICEYGKCEAVAKEQRCSFARELANASSETAGAITIVDPVCYVCAHTEDIKCCSKCKLTAYCSRRCQKRDWPRHKGECQARC